MGMPLPKSTFTMVMYRPWPVDPSGGGCSGVSYLLVIQKTTVKDINRTLFVDFGDVTVMSSTG